MREIMVNHAQSCDLKDLVQKFIPESIGRDIEKATSSIYPLQNVFIRKVKILKAPKFDLGKLMEVCIFYSNIIRTCIHPSVIIHDCTKQILFTPVFILGFLAYILKQFHSKTAKLCSTYWVIWLCRFTGTILKTLARSWTGLQKSPWPRQPNPLELDCESFCCFLADLCFNEP